MKITIKKTMKVAMCSHAQAFFSIGLVEQLHGIQRPHQRNSGLSKINLDLVVS